MSLVQSVADGKLVDSSADATTSSTAKNNGTTFDKEMFLKLLVAEMQYQDPLEPTSNTEYVSELASFSQIEAVQAVQDQVANMEAGTLVGKYVILLTTDSDGNTNYVSGKVDFVQNDDGDMYLSVNDKLYSIDDLYSVADEQYYEAVVTAQTITDLVAKLPTEANLTTSDEEKLTAVREILDSMDTYQLQFVSADDVKKLETLETKLAELKKAAGTTEDKTDAVEGSEGTEDTEDTQGSTEA